jgi:phage regulator Rha-like protein
MTTSIAKLPLVTDALELYAHTPEGLPLWKSKGVNLGYENLLENIFVLSSELADYFAVRHNDLVQKNICKLQKEGYLADHLRKISHMVEIGSSAKRAQVIYALTRHETEFLIMDFAGPKARQKKLLILGRLHAIEADVLRGAFDAAREKAQIWDGVALLKEYGFKPSVSEQLATKKDIVDFLNIPEATLNSFLRRHADQIQAVRLEHDMIRSLNSKACRMNGYDLDNVLRSPQGLPPPKDGYRPGLYNLRTYGACARCCHNLLHWPGLPDNLSCSSLHPVNPSSGTGMRCGQSSLIQC